MPKKAVSKKVITKDDDTEVIIDAVKELTKQISELTKTITGMKERHDRWVRSGKF